MTGRRTGRPANGILAALIVTLGGLGASADAAELIRIDVAGQEREARVYPGSVADGDSAPLVIVFHGLADSAWNFSNVVAFHDDWPEATVVYPHGLPRADRNGTRGWHGFRDNDANNDLAFVDALMELLSQRYTLDPERIYATGFSNGGHLTFNLLLDRPCTFAAFAPVGALAEYISEATTPRPVIYLFGRQEPREYSDAWQQTVVALAKLNRATGEKRQWSVGTTEFVAAPDGRPTVYGLYDAGHVWPDRGNELIIRFFKEHRLEGSCKPNASR